MRQTKKYMPPKSPRSLSYPNASRAAGSASASQGEAAVLSCWGPVIQGEPPAHAQFSRGDAEQVFHTGAAACAVGPVRLLGPPRIAADLAARLEQLGITPFAPEPEAPEKPSTAPVSAFERGVAALAQYKAREGSVTVPRAHVETIVVDGQEHPVKLGVFLSNSKSRRAKLTADKLAALAALGLNWAAS